MTVVNQIKDTCTDIITANCVLLEYFVLIVRCHMHTIELVKAFETQPVSVWVYFNYRGSCFCKGD